MAASLWHFQRHFLTPSFVHVFSLSGHLCGAAGMWVFAKLSFKRAWLWKARWDNGIGCQCWFSTTAFASLIISKNTTFFRVCIQFSMTLETNFCVKKKKKSVGLIQLMFLFLFRTHISLHWTLRGNQVQHQWFQWFYILGYGVGLSIK